MVPMHALNDFAFVQRTVLRGISYALANKTKSGNILVAFLLFKLTTRNMGRATPTVVGRARM
jgi:hypothetical protein